MEKKMYESPRMEMVKMEVSDMMACSVNAGGDVNIGYGGVPISMWIRNLRLPVSTACSSI